MAYDLTYTKHIVASPANVLADKGGKHIFNIELTADTDNGMVVSKGDFVELDLFKEGTASVTTTGIIIDKSTRGHWLIEIVTPGNGLFVYNPAVLTRSRLYEDLDEANFYNKSGDVVNGYQLAEGDVVEVSTAGIVLAENGSGDTETLQAGATVTVVDRKFTVPAPTVEGGGS